MFRSIFILSFIFSLQVAQGQGSAGVVSVNFMKNTTNVQYIDPTIFNGLVPDNDWANLVVSAGTTTATDLDGSTLDVSVVGSGTSAGGTLWNGWPQRGGVSGDEVTVSISNIPYEEYYIIAYVSGWDAAAGSVACNGVTKYYNLAPIVSSGMAQLIESTDTNGSDGYATGSYVVFGNAVRSFVDDSVELTLKKLNSVVIFSGFQIVEIKRNNGLTLFPRSPGIDLSADYALRVDGQDVDCYATWRFDSSNSTSTVNGRPVSPLSFSMFDFTSPVNVKLYLAAGLLDPDRLQIMPSSLSIQPTVREDYIEFMLNAPANVTIDPKGDGLHALHLFTNVPETDIPESNDPNVIYFGPGLHEIDRLLITNQGTTVYLAPGAVVRPLPQTGPMTLSTSYGYTYTNVAPAFHTYKNNVVIRGRGIISGVRGFDGLKRFQLINVNGASATTVKDIVLMDPTAWTTVFSMNTDLLVDNLKILGYFANSDGTVIYGGSNIVVRNTFLHNADDGLEIKTGAFPAQNIRFENCQVWCDVGGPMGIPQEAASDISNVVWSNITVLHYNSGSPSEYESRGVFLVHPVGGGTVSDVRFEDIAVENSLSGRPLIHIGNEKLDWAGQPSVTTNPYSPIRNVMLSNIKANNISNELVYLRDDSGDSLISGITLSNVVVNGSSIETVSALELEKVGTVLDPAVYFD